MVPGIACLIDDTTAHQTPTAQQLAEWNEHRKSASFRGSSKVNATPRPELDEQALKKRLERQRRKELQSVNPIENAPLSNPSMKEMSYSLTIPAASTFSWYQAKEYHTLDEAKCAGIWNYPSTPEDRSKCCIFRDLWKKGYYMGNGLRFGGDWLVYPGA